jgi:DeoR/GlpR family transcriptional regulator of sugar metabolism
VFIVGSFREQYGLIGMIAEERRACLLRSLNDTGYVQVAELAEELAISSATIRRDLYRLEKEGLCIRKRGGAVRASQEMAFELPYKIKQFQFVEEKKRIGFAAARLVEEGDTILLDAGSTTYALAMALIHLTRITVVTNDLLIAGRLAANPNIHLICTGGSARPFVFSLQGWQTETFIKNLKVNKTFLGADAIHADGYITNTNLDEVSIKQAMVEAAEQVVLVSDSSKFKKMGFYRVCDLSRVARVITDCGLPPDSIELLAAKNVPYELV